MNRHHRNSLPKGYKLHWYEIDSFLGQGGFGITYLARDTNLDQLVAIKEFLPQELVVRESDDSVHPITDGHSDTFGWGLSRFLNEARTLAKFRHPNIVRVHSVFEANNTAYMVMEYEHGRSLEDALKFRKIEGEAKLKAMLWPLLDGVELMHGSGFIHRDIKPGNIFLREDATPVLLDFGSARLAIGGQTRTLTTLVSPGYAPFEQYESTDEGGRQGPWTDIYSLGATLYFAVTGKGPPDALARANALLQNRPDPLIPVEVAAPPGFSSGFLHAIDVALAFQAADRPKNVAQWRNLLERAEAPETDFESTVIRARPGIGAAPDDSASPESAVTIGKTPRRGSVTDGPAHEALQVAAASTGGRARPAWLLAGLLALMLSAAGGWYAYLQTTDPTLAGTPSSSPVAEPRLPQETETERVQQGTASPTPVPPAAPPSADTASTPPPLDGPIAPPPPAATSGSTTDTTARTVVTPPISASAPASSEDPAAQLDQQARIDTLLSRAIDDIVLERLEAAASILDEVEAIDPQAAGLARARLALEAASRRQAEEQARLAAEAEAQPRAEELARLAAEAEARRRVDEEVRLAAEAAARRQAEERARQAAEVEARRVAEEQARLAAEAEEQARLAAAAADTGSGRVAALLSAAAADLDATRLTSPAGNNALDKYDEVLRLDPDNREAVVGRERIVDRYLELAASAAEAGRITKANEFLDRAEAVTPGVERIGAARAALTARVAAPPAEEPAPAPTPPASAAPAEPEQQAALASQAPVVPEQPAAPRIRDPAHLALMPVETRRRCFGSDDLLVRDAVADFLGQSSGLKLAYDAYTDPQRASLGARTWTGPVSERLPSNEVVRQMVSSADADIVLLAFIDCSHTASGQSDNLPFKIWTFDGDLDKWLVIEGTMRDLKRGVAKLLGEALKARRVAAGA